MIRLLIAGSRSITDVGFIYRTLNKLILPKRNLIECIVDGMAPEGVDDIAFRWAIENNFKVDENPADWNDLTVPICKIKTRNGKEYNCLAGFNRNQVMAEKSTHAIIINDIRKSKTGTPGSNDMVKRAKNCGVKVHEIKYTGK